MFEKLGLSLVKSTGYSVNIAGSSGIIPKKSQINGFSIFDSSRSKWFHRFFAGIKLIRIARKLKPAVLIVCTHELLWAGIFLSFNGVKIIYDIQENYRKNLRFSTAYPLLIAKIFGGYVVFWEWLSRPFIHHYFLAEKIYEEQLSFVRNRCTVLENKAIFPFKRRVVKDRNKNQWLFTGTISKQTGIHECIELFESYQRAFPEGKLTIAGICHDSSLLSDIRKKIGRNPAIELLGGEQLVDHHIILDLIDCAGIGFIHYHMLPHIKGKVPTKLYEYLAAALPILFFKENHWPELTTESDTFTHDSEKGNLQKLNNWIIKKKPVQTTKKEHFLWQDEELKLKKAILSLF